MALTKSNLAIFALGLAFCLAASNPTFAIQTEVADQASSDQETQATQAKKTKAKKSHEHFMRIRKNYRGQRVALETSITRYELKNEAGEAVTVDLIGAVHIGEKEYYEALNERFEQYDSMLYELVAPEGTVIPKGGREGQGIPTNPLAAEHDQQR